MLTNCPFASFHVTCIPVYPILATSAIIGVPCGCGLELKAPIGNSVSCQYGGSSMGPFFLPTFFPMPVFIPALLNAKLRVLVIDSDLGSIIFAAYNCNVRSRGSFSKSSTFDPGIGERRFAYFLYDSQLSVYIIPLRSNYFGDPNNTCLDSRYEFPHRSEWPQ